MEKFNCIALTGGGTAGHAIPALALVPMLRKYFRRIIYIGSEGGIEASLALLEGIEYFATPTVKFDRKKWRANLRIPRILHEASATARKILSDNGVNVVFSKGGYCALPAVLGAKAEGIPIVLHESDRTLGLANRFSRLFTPHLLSAFQDLPGGQWVGNPMREGLIRGDSQRAPRFAKRRPTLLVMGGSQGALAINQTLADSIDLLSGYNIIHLYGKSPIDIKRENYVGMEYCHEIENVFAAADGVVCRAGAGTLFELAALGKKVLMIPLPKGESRGDQEENAAYFAETYGFAYLSQEELTPQNFSQAIERMIHQPSRAHIHNPLEANFRVARYLYEHASSQPKRQKSTNIFQKSDKRS